jgi:hypothetical protein
MSHTMKLSERVIEHGLRGVTNLVLCLRDHYGGDLFYKTTYGEIKGTKETPTYGFD